MIKKLLIIIILTTNSLFVEAIDLKSYLEQVKSYSAEIKAASEAVSAANYNYEYMRRNFYPRLDASLTALYNLRKLELIPTVGMERYTVSPSLTMSQTIYNGLSLRSSSQKMEILEDMARQSELMTIENIIVAATSLYWRNVAAVAYLDIAKKYLDIVNSNYELIKLKYSEGVTSKNDLLMMETQKKEAEYNLNRAEKSREQLEIDFNILRGLEPSEDFTLRDSIMVMDAQIPIFSNSEAVVKSRNEYNISKLGVDGYMLDQKINRSKFLPQISAGVTGSYGTRPLNIDGSFIVDGSIFLSMSTQIFGWGQKRFKKLADRAVVQSSLHNLQQTHDQLSKEISSSYVSLTESYEQLSLSAATLEIATESLSLSLYSYDEGVISVIELLTSQISWLSAYNSKISANLNYRISYVLYQKSIGEL